MKLFCRVNLLLFEKANEYIAKLIAVTECKHKQHNKIETANPGNHHPHIPLFFIGESLKKICVHFVTKSLKNSNLLPCNSKKKRECFQKFQKKFREWTHLFRGNMSYWKY